MHIPAITISVNGGVIPASTLIYSCSRISTSSWVLGLHTIIILSIATDGVPVAVHRSRCF